MSVDERWKRTREGREDVTMQAILGVSLSKDSQSWNVI